MTGYRHVSLRNECNQPQGLATLFVHIRVTDYIPDAFAGAFRPVTSPLSLQHQLFQIAAVRRVSYWSNPLFLIFDIRALWRSVLSARAPECQKLKMVG